MMTKEQERKTLEQIKKILAGLDQDGYVATAMRGMVEDAEDNIENDWAMSRYDAWQEAEKKVEEMKAMVREAREEKWAIKAEMDALKKSSADAIDALEYSLGLKNIEIDKLTKDALKEVKEVWIRFTDGDEWYSRFQKVEYIDCDGFRFIKVTQENGWTESYKLDDIASIEIQ